MKAQEYIIADPNVRGHVADMIGQLDLTKKFVVIVKPFRKKRTLSQNALMWKWINEVADAVKEHSGYDADDLHEFFKIKLLPADCVTVVEVEGEIIERRTTTKMTKAQMTKYMSNIERW